MADATVEATPVSSVFVQTLNGMEVCEKVTVTQLSCRLGSLQAAVEEWGRSAQDAGRRERACVRLVLMRETATLKTTPEREVEVVLVNRLLEYDLEPLSYTVTSDGDSVFIGTHHTLRSWSRNFGGRLQADHTATTYEVITASDGTMTHRVIDTKEYAT